MFDDPWPEEPSDPYDELGDPEASFDLEIPDETDVPIELLRGFWRLVAVFNVGLFSTALGGLLIVFEGALAFGGALLAIGVASIAYGTKRYLDHRPSPIADGTESSERG